MSASVIVTIDGPAGTGKSSAAAALSQRLGFDMLDTGAMYRAVALLAIERGVSENDGAGLARVMDASHIDVDFSSRPPAITLDGRDVGQRIRQVDITGIVSRIASHHEVRVRMVDAQRAVAAMHARLITEGRDQGTVVFPTAALRIWLDARPETRARRRADELTASGVAVEFATVLADIIARDASDRGRAEGPLACPVGAVCLDTSDLSFAEVVDELERAVRARLPCLSVGCGCGGSR